MLLLEEKGNNMVNRTSELRGEIHRAQTRLNEAEREYEALTLERESCGATLQVRSKEARRTRPSKRITSKSAHGVRRTIFQDISRPPRQATCNR